MSSLPQHNMSYSNLSPSQQSMMQAPNNKQNQKIFPCPFEGCGKVFYQLSSLQKHERTHTKERPFKCQYCDKGFTQISNLRRHERTHTGEKPHVCGICHKSFTTSSNLKQHEQTHANKEERDLFNCPICNKGFHYKSSLNKHMKDHEKNIGNVDLNNSDLTINPQKFLFTENGRVSPTQDAVKDIFPANFYVPPLFSAEETGSQASTNQDTSSPNHCHSHHSGEYNSTHHHSHSHSHSHKNGHSHSHGHHHGAELNPFPQNSIKILHNGHIHYLYNAKLYHFNENGELDDHDISESATNPITCNPCKEITHFPNYSQLSDKYKALFEQIGDKQTYDALNSVSSCNSVTCSMEKPTNILPSKCKCTGAQICQCSSSSGCCGNNSSPKSQSTGCCGSNKQQSSPGGCCASKSSHKVPRQQPHIKYGRLSDRPQCETKEEERDEYECKLEDDGCKTEDTYYKPQHVGYYYETMNEKASSNGCGCSSNGSRGGSCGCWNSRSGNNCLCEHTKNLKHKHGPHCEHIPVYHAGHIDYIVDGRLHHPHGDHCDDHGPIQIVEESSPFKGNENIQELMNQFSGKPFWEGDLKEDLLNGLQGALPFGATEAFSSRNQNVLF